MSAADWFVTDEAVTGFRRWLKLQESDATELKGISALVEEFVTWATALVRSQRAGIVNATVTVSPASDNPSARLDFDSETTVARITVWESGDFHAEAMDVVTGHGILEQFGVSSQESSRSGALFDEIVASVMRAKWSEQEPTFHTTAASTDENFQRGGPGRQPATKEGCVATQQAPRGMRG